jgi:glycosyltransferase involved in cell wall biosynthesis
MSTATPRGGSAAPAPSLTVVMAGLDEEANVASAVGRVVAALERWAEHFEVIVIDDGSRDRMAEIAEAIAARDPRVRVLRNGRNLNYGLSLRRGLAEASGEWVLHEPMDLPLDPDEIEALSAACADADVVVVARRDRSAHSRWRRLTSWTNHLLLRLLFRPRASDLNFVQFYRRDWVQGLSLRATSPAFVTPELILRAERTGRRVREVAAVFQRRERGRAHFGRPKDILWTLRDMLGLRLRTWIGGWQA